MRRFGPRLIAVMLGMTAFGCADVPQHADMWVANHGGVLPSPDLCQARIEAVSQKLIAACTGRKIMVQVLATNAVTAYSLWDGHVFVTRGLMDHLDDAELQAAVAHELGHLLGEGHVQAVASLRGCCIDPDREVRADAIGAELLRTEGLSPASMVSMLKKVEIFGSLPPACIVAVNRRISLLLADSSNHQN